MNDNKRMSSTARKISRHFWWKQLWIMLFIDLVLIGILSFAFIQRAGKSVPEGEIVSERTLQADDEKELFYVLTTESGKEYRFSVWEEAGRYKIAAIIVLCAEGLLLLEAFGDVKVVRRRLRPLNELAKKAEMLGSMAASQETAGNGGRFDSLEEAISNIRPEAPGASIHVGDKELQSLEVAINNLLERMREIYREQNRFVSDASHELRTPIAVIQGYVNMLDRWGKDDPEILNEAIEALKNESEHMKNLVEQLLFLARGDSGRHTLRPEVFSLSGLMQEVWEEYTMIDADHRYLLEPSEEITVCADEGMIKQSIRIFVDNAVKYSAKGTIIRLGVRREEGAACYLVEDEGIGMEPDETVHVFERFYRSDTARNSQSGGTGLGLSIANWITGAHGGRITVLSRAGIGSRFTVRLPD